ncbi:hypothetical protein BH10CYA1_BH10CYA1_36070 [soil metagenome]
MFNLLTKLFGNHSKSKTASEPYAPPQNSGLKPQMPTSSRPTKPTSPVESSRLSDSTKPLTTSRTNMKARNYWSQGYYDANLAQSPQQQLNILYAPPVGPIAHSSTDEIWRSHETSGTAKQRMLDGYLSKSNREIQVASPQQHPQAEQSTFEPDNLSNTSEITLPRSTQEILRDMATNKDVDVRSCIASNELTPVEALWVLAEDESPTVRLKLVSNVKCPIPVLELLANDYDSEVALRATNCLRKVWDNKRSIA